MRGDPQIHCREVERRQGAQEGEQRGEGVVSVAVGEGERGGVQHHTAGIAPRAEAHGREHLAVRSGLVQEVAVGGGLHEGAHGSQRRREGVGGEERACETQREARGEIGVGEGFKEVKRGLRGGWFVREEELFRGDRRDCRRGRQLACLGDAPLGTADRIVRHLRHNIASLFVHGLERSVCQCRGWRVGTEHRVGENLGELRQVGGLREHQNALAEVVSKPRLHQLLVLVGQ